jgi:hydrogenase-4 component B
MGIFFISILLVFFGGVFSLVIYRRFALMKTVAVVTIGLGCILGLVDAITKLLYPGNYVALIPYQHAFAFSFRIDGLSAFFLAAIFLVSLFSTIYSYHYLEKAEKALRVAVGYLFLGILVAGMAMVVTAANSITFMLAWELMSLSSFFLVVYDHQSAENRKAGLLYFVFSHVGALFILAAFGILYSKTGNFGFDAAAAVPEPIKLLIFILSFIGFGSKAGVFPLHVWLPHAHPAAPSHVSAVMSGVMIKTGIYGILRIYSLLNLHTLAVGEIVLIAGAVSGVLGVVYALGQHDLKRLLAYHSVENIGIILIGIGIGMIGVALRNPLMAVFGFSGGLLHVLNHGLFKSLLFMGAGVVLQKTGTRSIDALGGLMKRMRITGTSFLIGSLAISGLPPFNGFVSEFLIYIGGFKGISANSISIVFGIIGIISLAIIGGLALACFTKVLGVVFQGEPRTPAAVDVDEKGPTMIIAMWGIAIICTIIGVFPRAFVLMAVQAVSALGLGYGRIPMTPFVEMTGNITAGVAVFLIFLLLIWLLRTQLYRGKTLGQAGTWGCGFTQPTPRMQYTGSSYAASILEFFKPVAPLYVTHKQIEGRFPKKTHYHSEVRDIAETNMEKGVERPVLWCFDKLRWIQHGDIHLYIGYILAAIIILLMFE